MPPTSEPRPRHIIIMTLMTTLMLIHVLHGTRSVTDVPSTAQVRFMVPHSRSAFPVNYDCPTDSKNFPATAVLASMGSTPPQDSLGMSLTSHDQFLSLLTGDSHSVPRSSVPAMVLSMVRIVSQPPHGTFRSCESGRALMPSLCPCHQ